MPKALPRLRMDLDFMPSPDPERPGLFIRDPFQYSEMMLIVPPALVPLLEMFDGQTTDNDLRELLMRMTGDPNVGEVESNFIGMLSSAGFLHDEIFEGKREARHREFAASPLRPASHAGSAYPAEKEEARTLFTQYMTGDEPYEDGNLIAIAAPHVSPFGGFDCYRAAYRALRPEHRERTFVILGTSHYGEPDRFGLTRKNFITPFGEAVTDTALVDELAAAAPGAVEMEDYCHATEHSIEFQVAFLQHVLDGPARTSSLLAADGRPMMTGGLLGPDGRPLGSAGRSNPVRILPILCGAYAHSIYEGGMPEDNEHVARFIGALGEIAARRSRDLVFVLGVDMAHMGARYGDQTAAIAGESEMKAVEERDRARIAALCSGDSKAYWDLVQQNQDDLKWCGASPFYTFSKALPQARGFLRRYDQWNIDDQSVVSFAGMTFTG